MRRVRARNYSVRRVNHSSKIWTILCNNHSEIHFLSKNHSIYIDISNDLNFDSKLASLKHSARNGIHTGISCRHFFHATIIPPLDVQRSGQAQETVICLFGLLFFSQNGMTLKNLQKLSNPVKSY